MGEGRGRGMKGEKWDGMGWGVWAGGRAGIRKGGSWAKTERVALPHEDVVGLQVPVLHALPVQELPSGAELPQGLTGEYSHH